MRNKWLYVLGALIAPHIMLVVGVIFLSKKDLEHKTFGLKLCQLSTIMLIIGSLVYYTLFFPIIGID